MNSFPNIVSERNTEAFAEHLNRLFEESNESIENSDKLNYLIGFMLGYPLYDIDYAMNLHELDEGIRMGKVKSNDYGYSVLSRGSAETDRMFERLSKVLDFAYYAFSDICELKEHLPDTAYKAYIRSKGNLSEEEYRVFLVSQ